MKHWAAPLSLWQEVTEEHYSLCRRAIVGDLEDAPAWRELSAELCAGGAAHWRDSAKTCFVFEKGAKETLLHELALSGSLDAFKRLIVGAWLRSPVDLDVPTIATWARELHLWAELGEIWVEGLRHRGFTGFREVVPSFTGLPDQVRRDHPLLSLASAIAGVQRAPSEFGHAWAGPAIVRDGILFHSQWNHHFDRDRAVVAGAIWMAVQRQLPSPGKHTRHLEATATRAAVIELIDDAASDRGRVSEFARQLFLVASAELLLTLDDPATAAAEADLAMLLGGGLLRSLAVGLRAIARELLAQSRDRDADPASQRCGRGEEQATRSPIAIAHTLAAGVRALAELDQVGVEDSLAAVPGSPSIGQPYAILRVWLEAMHGTLWGEPEVALANLDWGQQRVGTSEWRDPLARRLLTGARIHLLTVVGATQAAEVAISALPIAEQWLYRARLLLWSGEAAEAGYVAAEGVYDIRTPAPHRPQLLVVKAAALWMDLYAPDSARIAATEAAARSTSDAGNHLPLALLPTAAGLALLEKFQTTLTRPSADHGVDFEAARFRRLARRSPVARARVQLTSREAVLLPLLASPATVPEIAEQLSVSVHTVRKQVATLRSKFGASTRAELVHLAAQAERHPQIADG